MTYSIIIVYSGAQIYALGLYYLHESTLQHSRLCLGAELMVQRGAGMEAGMLSVGGAYRCEEWEATARLGLHSWHLSYLHKLKDLDLVAECEGSLMQVGAASQLSLCANVTLCM